MERKYIFIAIAVILIVAASGYVLIQGFRGERAFELFKVETYDSDDEVESDQKGILKGRVIKKSGDCMPQVDGGESSCQSKGIEAVVQIRNLKYSYDSSSEYQVISEVRSDPDGRFEIKLPEGRYSIFVGEDGDTVPEQPGFEIEFHCGMIGSDGEFCPVEIKLGETTEYDPVIDLAVY